MKQKKKTKKTIRNKNVTWRQEDLKNNCLHDTDEWPQWVEFLIHIYASASPQIEVQIMRAVYFCIKSINTNILVVAIFKSIFFCFSMAMDRNDRKVRNYFTVIYSLISAFLIWCRNGLVKCFHFRIKYDLSNSQCINQLVNCIALVEHWKAIGSLMSLSHFAYTTAMCVVWQSLRITFGHFAKASVPAQK